MEIDKTILFRMTGCPNGCGPYMAELALVGRGKIKYQLWLEAVKTFKDQPNLTCKMELEDLEKTIKPLLECRKNNETDENFGDFIYNSDDSLIINLLKEEID